MDPERKRLLARKRKKMGAELFGPRCAVCGHVYTEEEILAESFIYSVGRGSSIQLCHGCLREYLSGGLLHAIA